MNSKSADYWIKKLNLLPHPEGGFYAETFRANLNVNGGWGNRSALTSIFYLLEKADFSAFHKIKSPELWYFHAGNELYVHEISSTGEYYKHVLNLDNPFVAIAPESWFASEVANQTGYILVSCAVAPGFDFADFEIAKRESLIAQFPNHQQIISRLTR